MKKVLKVIFSRLFIVGILITIQLGVLGFAVWSLSEKFIYLYFFFIILSMAVVIYIISRKDNPSYKLAWTIPVLLQPVFGGLFYLIFGGNKMGRKMRDKIANKVDETKSYIVQDEDIIKEIEKEDKHVANQVKYINKYAGFPICKNTYTKYLSPGEEFFKQLICELKRAKEFIFFEYFIIHEGKMWNEILSILEEKVKEGVDVRVIYDDLGCINTLPNKYSDLLISKGIKCKVFNEFTPSLNLILNNRDHRKITVIDGYIAFTGGNNLADEYINEIVRFGHWKDASILIKGEGVKNLTIMFLQVWSFNENEEVDYEKYMPKYDDIKSINEEGYVLPYGDSPLDNEIVGENVYLNIINKSENYVYINTPYLIIDNELVTALTLAAKSGIDVRIVTPHKEDKWYAHMVTRSYYHQLIQSGVRIYEYTPGFIHSKTFVSDDKLGVVGTINMDYRSLYLHFECGVWLYKTQSILEIKEDFLNTLEKCKEITLEEASNVSWANRLIRSILKVFAPLM